MANVVGNDGGLVSGLNASNFQARFRGQPVRILSANFDAQPRRIVLLLDASGSMLEPGEGKWKLVLSVAKDAVEKLSPQHSLALLVFAEKIDESVDFGHSRQAILQRLSDLDPGRRALPKGSRRKALWDALLEGLRLLGSPQRGDVLYAITDGVDNQSRVRPGAVRRALLAAGVRLFAFLPVNSLPWLPPSPEEVESLSSLFALASHTGGISLLDYVNPPPRTTLTERPLSPAQLRVALDSLYGAMNSFYRLEIELPRPVEKMQSWKLELANLPGKAKQRPELAYSRELLPCTAP